MRRKYLVNVYIYLYIYIEKKSWKTRQNLATWKLLQQTRGNPRTKMDRRMERRRDRSEKRGMNGRRKRKKEREREREWDWTSDKWDGGVGGKQMVGRNAALHPSGGDRSGSREGEVRRTDVSSMVGRKMNGGGDTSRGAVSAPRAAVALGCIFFLFLRHSRETSRVNIIVIDKVLPRDTSANLLSYLSRVYKKKSKYESV